jgi:Ca2+-transporting ATPase
MDDKQRHIESVDETCSPEPYHAMDVDFTLQTLETSRKGLPEKEAHDRLVKYGYNTLAERKKVSTLQIFLDQFKDFFILLLLGASLISALLGETVDAITIGAIIVLVAVVGFVQNYRGEKALEAMKRMTASTVRVIRDSQEKAISALEIVPGDILVLEEGDRMASDARLIESVELRTVEAALTGESTPVEKDTRSLEVTTQVSDRRNTVFSGTYVAYGRGKAVVIATGYKTEFGKIANLLQEVKETETPLQQKMDRFSKVIAKVVLVVCALIFALEFLRLETSENILLAMTDAFMAAVSLAISAVPEGIPAITAVTLALGARDLVKRNAIIRKLSSAETLGSVTVICSDKTGTLTRGEMTVRQAYVSNHYVDVSGSGYDPKGEFNWDSSPKDPDEEEDLQLLLRIGLLCNNARLEYSAQKSGAILGDPTEGALIVAASKAGLDRETVERKYPRVREVPFSSERKMMTTGHQVGDGEYIAYVKGAPEVVLKQSSEVLSGGKDRALTDSRRRELSAVNERMAGGALRVLAMAYKKLPPDYARLRDDEIEKDLVFVGFEGMIDPPRDEAREANLKCEKAGIRTVMITGDHKLTATAVAKEIGMFKSDSMVLTGAELDALDDAQYSEIVDKISVYARVSPEHKQRIVRALKAKGHIVAMTGDGVNDAPAIKNADIGIAMGITGTDVTKEASHMILADDNFATIVRAVEHGRVIFDNIRKYTRFLIACNFDEVLLLAVFAILGWPLPMLPAMILWINLATDGGPAIALSMDPPEEDVMSRPPRDPKEGILHGMLSFVVVSFTLQFLGSLVVFLAETWTYISVGLPIPENVLMEARTAVFIQATLFELLVVWNCRSEKRSVWRMNIFKNKFLVIADVVALLATASLCYIPVTQAAFRLVPLTLYDWLWTGGVASLALLVLPEVFYGRKIWRWR